MLIKKHKKHPHSIVRIKMLNKLKKTPIKRQPVTTNNRKLEKLENNKCKYSLKFEVKSEIWIPETRNLRWNTKFQTTKPKIKNARTWSSVLPSIKTAGPCILADFGTRFSRRNSAEAKLTRSWRSYFLPLSTKSSKRRTLARKQSFVRVPPAIRIADDIWRVVAFMRISQNIGFQSFMKTMMNSCSPFPLFPGLIVAVFPCFFSAVKHFSRFSAFDDTSHENLSAEEKWFITGGGLSLCILCFEARAASMCSGSWWTRTYISPHTGGSLIYV